MKFVIIGAGIVGLSIVKNEDRQAIIDTFLMSCRIIGRNIEYVFFDYIIDRIKEKGINTVKSKYIKTKKNEQVMDFYDRCSFNLIKSIKSEKKYTLDLIKHMPKEINYIEIING